MNLVQVLGNGDPIVVLSATGTGASPTTFIHNTAAEGGRPGQLYPAGFLLAITDIVGSFSGLQVNLEWSPITTTDTPQFQTIGSWTPLTNPTTYFPCSSTGQYRLNCTSFAGGTSFNVYASIAASMPQSVGGSSSIGSVTQGTTPWVDNISQVAGVNLGATAVVAYGTTPAAVVVPGVNAFVTNAGSIGGGIQFADAAASGTHPTGTQIIGWNKGGSTELAITALSLANAQPLAIAVVDGSGNQITSFGGGTQFADNAASGATPTGTLSMGWDSANSKVRALKVDSSQNLLVDVSNASIAVTGTFWQATQPVSGTFFQATQPVSISATVIVAGAKTPADSYTNPTDAEDAFALLGGWDATNSKWQRVQVDTGTGTLKVDPGTVAVTGTFWQATQPVSGTFWQATQPVSIAAAVDVSDRAARLLGVIYGSQAQQLKQTASNFNSQVELATGATLYDARQIRALTSADVVDVSDRSARLLGNVTVDNASIAVTGTFWQATQPVSGTFWQATQPISGTVTANQGTANTLANKWPVQITDGTNVMPTGDAIARALFHSLTDGTNGPVAVKPASTAAVAGDAALVVAISPNNPITVAPATNAALESGGNLATIASQPLKDILTQMLLALDAVNMNLGRLMSGDPTSRQELANSEF